MNYKKAFNGVDHIKLWNMLRRMEIPEHLMLLMKNVYRSGNHSTGRTC